MSVIYDFVNYNRSFSQLAKESNFTFNLYRGRVDWKKLEVVEIDRIVRDQDVELLNIYMDSVTNCNLDSEYDVKILDPNFIKLFRLAQLLIDFLIHCKKYLEHCIKVAHESLQASNKEVELLRKQLQARKSEVKQLKKKVKEIKQQLLHSPRVSNPTFQCLLCGKVFMNESYLHGHYSRRHQSSYCLRLMPQPTPQPSPIKIDKQENEKYTNKPEDMTNVKKKYQEEIEELKNMFFAEIEKLKQNEMLNSKTGTVKSSQFTTNSNHPDTEKEDKQSDIVEVKEMTSKELSVNVKDKKPSTKETDDNSKTQPADVRVPEPEPTKVPETDKEVEGEWVRRLEEREKVWRARLSALDLQHKKQVQQLENMFTSSQLEGQEMKKDMERRLEEVLSKFEQSQTLIKSYQLASKNDEIKKNHNILESTLASSLSDLKIQSMELKDKKIAKNQSPFQRRKAFVSQKSKTIQDSVEAQQDENLVEILQPDVDSDIEIVSLKAQSNDTDKSVSNERSSKQIFEVDQDKDKLPEKLSKSKNTEMIVKKLLEEEKQRTFGKTSEIIQYSIEEDESSITETSTDSESEIETSEDKQNQELQKSGSADRQLLHAESQMAQQSLQSMENLLAANPRILQQLREELQQLLRRRLQGLGVDPSWGALPPSTFSSKMATLSHQRQITAKNHKIYYTLRDKLSHDADTAAAARRMSADQQTAEDSLLSRLRRKAALVINATKFTYHMESLKKKDGVTKSSATQFTKSQPLASSSPKMSSSPLIASNSPQQAASNTSYDSANLVIPKIQATSAEDSLSLLSSCEEEEEEEDKQITVQVTAHPKPVISSETGSYKSALRNAVSTGSLAKKKVLFVDEAIRDDKRSLSESSVIASHSVGATRSQSVASLVQEIQQQLGQRSGKPANSVDLLSLPEAASKDTLELPLSQILPLSRSGRELLQGSLGPELAAAARKRQGMNVLQLPSVLSPPHSISSLASSQLDSPTSNLDWALQDLEDNLRE